MLKRHYCCFDLKKYIYIYIIQKKLYPFSALDPNARSLEFRRKVISAVNDLIEDINTCHLVIAELAVEHIHHK